MYKKVLRTVKIYKKVLSSFCLDVVTDLGKNPYKSG